MQKTNFANAQTDNPTNTHDTRYIKHHPVITVRSIILGTILIPINCYWLAVMEIRWNSVDATCVSLFFHVIFVIFILSIINRWLNARFPKIAMSPAELLVIYIMLSIASAISGRDSLENLLPLLGHPFWFADSSNNYASFHRFIPSWLGQHDPKALRAFYLGGASINDWNLLRPWIPLILAWSIFILAMLTVMLSISVIVRKHWMDSEKLTFPTVYLPVEMARDRSFFSNRTLWLGFAMPFSIQMMNGLHHLYPSAPYINLKLQDISHLFTTSPWNGLGWTPISFYPFAIGMAFFLPLDLSFSCWFFYIVKKMEAVLGTMFGYKNPGGWSAASWPYLREQGTGAWIGLCGFLIWTGRKYFFEILKTAIGNKHESELSNQIDSGELISYRSACFGVIIGLLAMFAFCVRAGMPLWLPPIYFGLFFLLSIGVTRIRAELGPPAHELNWINPENIVVSLLGTEKLGTQNLTILSYMFWFNRGYRSHPMPHQLEGIKIGRDMKMEPRRLLVAVVIACVISVFAMFLALLDISVKHGAATANIQSYYVHIGFEAFNRLSAWTAYPKATDIKAISWIVIGFAFTVFLIVMKSRFFVWPFHPAGYALANSYALEYWWMPIMICWLIKILIIRYSGIKGYRRALPLFMGLILGDYVAAGIWSIVGWILRVNVYRVFIL